MKLHTLIVASVFAGLAVPYAAPAQTAPPAGGAPTAAPSPTPDALAYDDPGMHFRPPDGWSRVPLTNAPALQDGRQVLAGYVQKSSHGDPRQILLVSGPTTGSLDADETAHENQLRGVQEGTFVSHKSKTALANGMPAYFLSVNEGSDPLRSEHVYEYIIYDGFRAITASLASLPFDISEGDAKKAFASLYVVAYPRRRE